MVVEKQQILYGSDVAAPTNSHGYKRTTVRVVCPPLTRRAFAVYPSVDASQLTHDRLRYILKIHPCPHSSIDLAVCSKPEITSV